MCRKTIKEHLERAAQHLYRLELKFNYRLVIDRGEKHDSRMDMLPSTMTTAAIAKLHIQDKAKTKSHIR